MQALVMALSFEARDDAAIAVAGSYVVFPLSSRLTAWFRNRSKQQQRRNHTFEDKTAHPGAD